MRGIFLAIYRYRSFILGSVKREFQAKYQSSLLGPLWLFMQPLSLIIIYTVIFSGLMRAKLPASDLKMGYSIYLCAGIILWFLFTELLTRSSTVFIRNANLIKKLSFPKVCLPVITLISSLINFFIILSFFIIFLLLSNTFYPSSLFLLIPVVIALLFFVIGFGLLVGTLNVFFRDVGQFITVFMQFWFWLTPIVYPLSILPQWVQSLLSLNPLTGVVRASQEIFLTGRVESWGILLPTLIAGTVFSMLGFFVFKQHHNEMVDEL